MKLLHIFEHEDGVPRKLNLDIGLRDMPWLELTEQELDWWNIAKISGNLYSRLGMDACMIEIDDDCNFVQFRAIIQP